MKIGLVIPTYNAGEKFISLLESIKQQSYEIERKVVIDSNSTDETVCLAKRYDYEVIRIAKKEFNHGRTRQIAAEYLNDVDIVIFITQDVIFADACGIERLVAAFTDEFVGAAYGRQLPHFNASAMAAQARLFNYPKVSKVKSYENKTELGIKTAFMSDSFAAYRVNALRAVNGFPSNIIVSEDMYVAAKMLMQSYKIAYVADAKVYHSHDYTLLQELRRYFDTGVFQSRENWIGREFGKAEGEGVKLVLDQLKYLYHHDVFAIPKAILANVVKFIGYKLGYYEKYLPVSLKRILSGQPYYFIR